MSADNKKNRGGGLRREAPPALIVAAIVLVLCGVGAGIFYLVNNGWQTQSQKDDNFYHHYLPLQALSHGDRKPFDDENALRKKEGRPPLVEEHSQKPTPAQMDAVQQNIARLKAFQEKSPPGAAH